MRIVDRIVRQAWVSSPLLLGAVVSLGCSSRSDGGANDFEGDDANECSDDADNDQDGLFDCADPDCAGSQACGAADSSSTSDDATGVTDDSATEDPSSPATGDTSSNDPPDTSSNDTTDTSSSATHDTASNSGPASDLEPDTDTDSGSPADSDTGTGGAVTVTDWLHTEGNRILHEDGTPFRGRGADIHDTRSCWACAYSEPNVDEVKRRVDALVDDWGANLMRLVLESYELDEWMVHGDGVLEDAAYLEDIVDIVTHIGTKPGVYVLVTLWVDKHTDDMGWPTEGTYEEWAGLSERLLEFPHVMFGIVNEPQSNYDGTQDAEVWERMNTAVETIRGVEAASGSPKHLIAVQGTRAWARHLEYYVDHPIAAGDGENVVYETHSYIHADEFEEIWIGPSATLPVIIGEFGPTDYMTLEETSLMMDEAEKRDIPWMAWTFHQRCPPSLLVDHDGSGCGVDMALTPSEWGTVIQDRLATPWLTQ